MKPFYVEIAAQSDIGRRKQKNEDSHGEFRAGEVPGLQLFTEGAMLCVADGLGGHLGGEIASKLAVAMMKDALKQPPAPPSEDLAEDGPVPVLREAFRMANDGIFRDNQQFIKNGRPMGTTLLTAIVQPKKVYVGNTGDSRCYHLRDGEIIDHTEDHSWVDEQVKLGLMSKNEAERDSRKNIVTRCIGTHPEVEVDMYRWHIVPGDMLLLCTDGLVNMVKDADIAAEFRRNASPVDIAQRLVNLANENGGKDNITVVVAEICPTFTVRLVRRYHTLRKTHARALFWLWTLLVAGAAAVAGYFARGFVNL
jgi:PPM family protein phosphatase